MNKPEPPPPRLIREDFMPEENRLKNYRILKTQDERGNDIYYPQYKFLGLIWLYLNAHKKPGSFEDALFYIKRDIIAKRKPTVEYLEVTEKHLEGFPRREPNQPPKNP